MCTDKSSSLIVAGEQRLRFWANSAVSQRSCTAAAALPSLQNSVELILPGAVNTSALDSAWA